MARGYAESEYEEAILELFQQQLDYDRWHGPDVERDFHSPIYEPSLVEALERINPNVPREALDDALFRVKNVENGSLVQKNEQFANYLQNGVPARYFEKGEERWTVVRLVDFVDPENNEFVVANQWTFVEKSEKRLDVVLFVNGLPLVVVELKSPSREETDASAGYRQLRNYVGEIPSFFIYNAVCVMSDFAVSKAGTITSNEDRYMQWKTVDGSGEKGGHVPPEVLFQGIFEKRRFLDILENFICFNAEVPESRKILAGYHQYYAVNKALESVVRATKTDGRGGVFWHTQGSGKSLSMVFFAHGIQRLLHSPTLVVITDRNDLDDQLFSQFARCSKFLGQEPIHATSRDHLRQLLKGREAGGIVFTTMMKFEEDDEPLSTRDNVVVIADEAHRSQYGLVERFQRVKNPREGEPEHRRIVGAARVVRNNLPNATFIGFTGTPIATKDKNTCEVFGDCVDVYDMTQAVEDGATRPVYYESRGLRLKLKQEALDKLDAEYDRLAENAEPYIIEKSKQELGSLDALLGADETLDSLVDDILEHYETHRQHLLTGKALLVAYSREIAIKIYRKILERRPDWTEKVAVVLTNGNNDPEDWKKLIGNKTKREETARLFKDDASPLKIAIVVDMWLTGFDVPSLATMYVFKPMSGHNLMQAIARVNRVYKDKEGGLVVDYIGLATALKAAMRDYTQRDQSNYGNMNVAESALLTFREKLEICRDCLHGFDYSCFASSTPLEQSRLISAGVDFILDKGHEEALQPGVEPEKMTPRVLIREGLALRQALSLCGSIAEEEERVEAAFIEAVRLTVFRLSAEGAPRKFSLREINERINELLKQTVQSEGVVNLFSETRSKFSIFDPKFLADIAKMKERNIAVELLKRLIDGQIKVYERTNVVRSEKFSELLQKAMARYINGLITNEEVVQELLRLANEIANASAEGRQLGLTAEELAFYDALTQPRAIKDLYEHDQLVAMTKELTDALRQNRTIDWQKKESARASMRVMIKRLLRKYKYPPEDQEDALKIVMSQCEHWADASSEDYEEAEKDFEV